MPELVPADSEKEESADALLERLALLYRLAPGAWAIGEFENEKIRQARQADLARRIAPLELIEVSFIDEEPDPLYILRAIPAEGDNAPVVAFVHLPSAIPRLYLNLDLKREAIAKLPHRILIWATESERLDLLERAPNFYSRISGVFRFPGRPDSEPEPFALSVSRSDSTTLDRRINRLRPLVPVRDEKDRAQLIAYFRDRIAALEKLPRRDPRSLGDAWADLGGLLDGKQLPKAEAATAYCRAADWYRTAEDPSAEIDVLLSAAGAAIRRFDLKVVEGVLQRFNQANLPRNGEFWLLQGTLALHRDLLDKASFDFEMAQESFRQNGDRRGEANAQKAFGDLLVRTNRTRQAEGSYGSALSTFQGSHDQYGEAKTRKALGDLFLRTDRLKEAEEEYKAALAIAEKVETQRGGAHVWRALGDLFSRTDRAKEAEEAYATALQTFQDIEERLGEANTRGALGDLFFRTDRLKEAKDSYKQALSIFQHLEDRLGEAEITQKLERLTTALSFSEFIRAPKLSNAGLDPS